MKLLIAFITVAGIYPIFAYRMYYVEDECNSRKDEQKVVYNIPAAGANSVGEMRSNRFGTYSRTGRSCLIKLKPPKGYGLVVTVKKVDFRNHKPCDDYIKIYADHTDGEKICSYLTNQKEGKTYFSEGKMEILYHTEDGGYGFNDGFRLIFTVAEIVEDECSYENQFKCANSRCIWIGATCDGQNNCGDFSDESNIGISKCSSMTPITVAVIALAIVTLMAIIVSVCLCCCRAQQQAAEKNKLLTDFPSRPNGGYIPLPGYSFAVPESDVQHLVNNPYYPSYTHGPLARTNCFQDYYPQQSPLEMPPPYKA